MQLIVLFILASLVGCERRPKPDGGKPGSPSPVPVAASVPPDAAPGQASDAAPDNRWKSVVLQFASDDATTGDRAVRSALYRWHLGVADHGKNRSPITISAPRSPGLAPAAAELFRSRARWVSEVLDTIQPGRNQQDASDPEGRLSSLSASPETRNQIEVLITDP